MTNFNLLHVESCDQSTDNLQRKYHKLLSSQYKNPSDSKLERINYLKSILYPEKVNRKKYVKRKKIINQIFNNLSESNGKLRKYFDERIFRTYIELVNILPHEVVLLIIKSCEYNNLKKKDITIPRNIYMFCQKPVKDKYDKDKLIEHYHNYPSMVNFINKLYKS